MWLTFFSRPLARSALALVVVALAGCGGGGGGGANDAGGSLNFSITPTEVVRTLDYGQSISFVENARVTGTVSGPVTVVIHDPAGVIEPFVSIEQQSETAYTARFTTASGLTVGTHTGTIDILLCSDSACATRYASTPLRYRFTVLPTPSLQSVSPETAVAGSPDVLLSLTGVRFDNSVRVLWDDRALETTFVSPEQMSARLTNADLSEVGSHAIEVRSDSRYYGRSTFVVQYPAPTLSALTPANAAQNRGNLSVTVSGTGFYPQSSVYWNGSYRQTHYLSPTRLTVDLPAADFATAGYQSISVSNPTPGGGFSEVASFEVDYPQPSLTLINAKSAKAGCGDFKITVVGTEIRDATTVLWNGSPRPTVKISPTVVQAEITGADIAAPGAASVTLRNPLPGGGVSEGANFLVSADAPATTNAATYRLNPSHNLASSVECPVSLPTEPAWIHQSSSFANPNPPLIIGNNVILSYEDGELYSVEPGTGAVRWGAVNSHSGKGPAYANGLLFATGARTEDSSFISAYRLDDGTLAYSTSVATRNRPLDYVTAAGELVLATDSYSDSTMYALRQSDGALVWQRQLSGNPRAPVATDGTNVYVGAGARTYSIDVLTGGLKWQSPFSGLGAVGATLVDGLVNAFLTTDDVTRGTRYRADTGEIAGNFDSLQLPTNLNGIEYSVTEAGLVARRRSDEALLWTFASANERFVTGLVVVNDLVLVGGEYGSLYALDLDSGTLLRRYQAAHTALMNNRIAVGNGYLIVGSSQRVTGFILSNSP